MNLQNVLEAFTKADPKECILALIVGFVLGLIFIKLKLPIPAPPVLSGILGIIGIWLGFLVGKK